MAAQGFRPTTAWAAPPCIPMASDRAGLEKWNWDKERQPSMRSSRRAWSPAAQDSWGPISATLYLPRAGRWSSSDNLLTGRRANLEHLRNEPVFEFVEKDICEPFDVGHVDYVFHFACPASPVDYTIHGIPTLKVGSLGTFHALDVAHKYGAKYFVSSTSECYGDPLEHPQKETYWGNVNPIGPRSVYDEAKRFTEAMTMAYHRYHKVDTRIVPYLQYLRPAHATE